MRVSVTLADELNKTVTEQARKAGISKDRYLGVRIAHYEDLLREVDDLKMEIKQLTTELQEQDKIHNARGAGRKQVFGDAHKLAMQAYRINGMSYREIAKIYKCSVGTVYKLINEQD